MNMRTDKIIACRYCNWWGGLQGKPKLLYFRTRDMSIRENQILELRALSGKSYPALVINPDVSYFVAEWDRRDLEERRIGGPKFEDDTPGMPQEAKPMPERVKSPETVQLALW